MLTVDATVVVRAYREGTDWQTQLMWTRRAKLGECEVALLRWLYRAPVVVASQITNGAGNARISFDLGGYSGPGFIWVKHLTSGAMVGMNFEIEGGAYVEGTLSDLEVLNWGSTMPATFNQPQLPALAATLARLRIGRRR